MYFNKEFYAYPLKISFYFFPISFVIGSLIINLNIIIFSILGFIFLYLSKIKIRFNLINFFLLLFFLTSIISSFINIDIIGKSNFYKSIFLLRFYILYILIETLFLNKKIDFKYFFYTCYICIIILSLDLSLQFFHGKNILGYEPWEGRITGLFEHEAIAGSYLQKIFIFSLAAIYLKLYKSKNNKNILIFSSFIIIIFASFIASNRISFIILISLIILLIIFFKVFRKNLILSLIFLVPFFYYFYQTNEQVNLRYLGFTNKVIKIINVNKSSTVQNESNIQSNPEINRESNFPNHLKIFNTSYKSFKDKYIIGNGIKSFRYKCKNYLNQKNTLCSTHPHNYHLEVLNDTGLFGFIFLSIFVFLLIWKNLKLIFNKDLTYDHKILVVLLILNFLIEVFPFKSTGSFFTTWNGSLLWLSIALLNFKNKNNI